MEQLENGTAVFTPQDDAASTHVGMIKKEMGSIDWSRPAVEIERQIRGLNPWPSAYTQLDGRTFKIWRAEAVTDSSGKTAAPGTVLSVGKKEMLVQTGEGVLSLLEVQLAGKKRMDIGSFLRGCPVEAGIVLQA
jgi:methionyl-tRNA formyltransferase